MYRKVVKPDQKLQEESKQLNQEDEDSAYKLSKKNICFLTLIGIEQKEK